LGIVISTACLGQASASRSVNQKGAKNEARPLTEIERRGLENLDRIALEARQIDKAAIRTELQSLIGDALWEFDKSSAKSIFLDAFKNARAIADKRQATVAQTQVIQRVWARDRAWAEELMKQLAETKEENKNDPQGDFGVSSQFGMKSASPVDQQKLELARELLEVDSGAAAELIGTSLQNDVSFPGINLLAQLRGKDPQAADMIFQRAVQKLSDMPQPSGIIAAIAMGDYLSPSCALCSASNDAPGAGVYYASALGVLRRSLGQPFAPPPVRRDLQDRLQEYFHEMQATLALSLSKFAGPTDLPQLEAIYREQVQTLDPVKQLKLEGLRNMQRSADRFQDLRQNAETIPDAEQRDKSMFSLVEGAMRQHPSDDRLAKLAELVDKIQSTELHDRAWSLLKRLEVAKLTQAGNFDDAYQLAIKLPDAAIRAQALRDLSLAVARKGSETLRSQDVLAQALEAIDKADASIERSRLMFKITSDFVNMKDYDRAFGALQYSASSLGPLNRDEFEQTPKAPVPNSLFDYRNTFGRLGSVDFDRTMFLAQGIKWREFRLAAEIATCQSALSKKG
jgi:hypothetical protein